MPVSGASSFPSYIAKGQEAAEASKHQLSVNASVPRPGVLASLPSWICLAGLVLGTGEAAAQNGEDLEALSRDSVQWVIAPKNYANTRSSELDQINPDNVDRLQVAWRFSIGVNQGQEAAPLVVGNTMYVVARTRTTCSLSMRPRAT